MSPAAYEDASFSLTVDERAELGRAARQTVPRAALGEWSASPERPDPITLLQDQEATRVPWLLPLRHERMGVSAFTFYRGTALVMATDLASMPNTGLTVQLCGDAHLSNFGLFAAPDRQPVFDLNDFDETNPGPFEWDVQRLAVSFALAAEDNKLTDEIGTEAVGIVARQYRDSMAAYAAATDLDIWYDCIDASQLTAWAAASGKKKVLRGVTDAVGKARKRDAWSALSKLTHVVDGQRQFIDNPPVVIHVPETTGVHETIDYAFGHYRESLLADRQFLLSRYRPIDLGHKVVGVGSVGLLAWVVLLQGRDANDLIALQIKQAQASVLEAFTAPSAYPHHGQRVVEGQRLIQAASDTFLGWTSGPLGREYYVRQLRDMKWSPDPSVLGPDALRVYAGLCGHVLARAHARSGDPIAISAYLGSGDAFEKAVIAFSKAYVPRVRADFAEFEAAMADGRLAAGDTSDNIAEWHAAFADPSRYGRVSADS